MLAALCARDVMPSRILEPTCGSGAFLRAAATTFPAAEILGIEYQSERYAAALTAVCDAAPSVNVRYANAYEVDFAALPWSTRGPLLVVGNPPWITAAALGRLPGQTLQPPRSNLKRLTGLAARTGAANFDVAEFLILKVLRELRSEPLVLALLVKESVARNVLDAAQSLDLGVTSAEIVRIDARTWFDAAVDACCLILATRPHGALDARVAVRPNFSAAPSGWFRPALTSQKPASAIVFRQGIKHDAADVFELRRVGDIWRNGYGEDVDVEPAHVFALLKAGALHAGKRAGATAMIVPQVRLGAPTDVLAVQAPRLWAYLCRHADRIAARKSSIYRNAPPFAVFGIGPYSFAPWKVAVAGFYLEPRFRIVGPYAGRPVVFGDTSYFVPFENEADARAFGSLCASPVLAAALSERVSAGKRPITKALLDNLPWPELAAKLDPCPDRLRALLREPALA